MSSGIASTAPRVTVTSVGKALVSARCIGATASAMRWCWRVPTGWVFTGSEG